MPVGRSRSRSGRMCILTCAYPGPYAALKLACEVKPSPTRSPEQRRPVQTVTIPGPQATTGTNRNLGSRLAAEPSASPSFRVTEAVRATLLA
jgi:hypothetical protein